MFILNWLLKHYNARTKIIYLTVVKKIVQEKEILIAIIPMALINQ